MPEERVGRREQQQKLRREFALSIQFQSIVL
jgi:hypothetical protein